MGTALDLSEVFSRHLPVLGSECIERLRSATVLVVGVGGLGTAASLYLALTGVKRLLLVDDGVVELSNLNRQVLYTPRDVGKPKVYVARERLGEVAPWVEVEAIRARFSSRDLGHLVKEVDVVIEALDNWSSRRELNRACLEHGKPLVHGGVEKWFGQVTTVVPCESPCLECFAPRKEVSGGVPVLPQLPGVVGLLQAVEAIKLLCGWGKPLVGRMLLVDLMRGEFEEVKIVRNPRCPACSSTCRS